MLGGGPERLRYGHRVPVARGTNARRGRRVSAGTISGIESRGGEQPYCVRTTMSRSDDAVVSALLTVTVPVAPAGTAK